MPFLYSTNGEQVFFIDIRPEKSYSRQVSSVHTAEALQEFYDTEFNYSWFERHPVDIPRLRYYQKQAIQETEKAIIGGRRNLLLAMAT